MIKVKREAAAQAARPKPSGMTAFFPQNAKPYGLEREAFQTEKALYPLRLSPGDCVLMVSDGICGAGDDGWLRKRLERFTPSDSPKDLARDLITHSPVDATDDRTALVVRIQRRPEE